MHKAVAACLALLAVPLGATGEQAGKGPEPEANAIYVAGEVTHLLVVDLDTVVVTAGGQDILLPCPQVKFPGCLKLDLSDRIRFFGHFGPAVEDPGPSGTGLKNPLEADDIQLCDNGGCYTLSVGHNFSSKE